MTAQECLELADFMDARGCPQAAAAWRADADALQTDPDNGELDIEAYEPADARDVYASDDGMTYDPRYDGWVGNGNFVPSQTHPHAQEPESLWWDLAINRAADGGRVVNFERAQA